jgi:hypothetical protein
MDGRSNNNDLLKDEILNKLNPTMYRQLFSGPSDEHLSGKMGKLIDEIPEEDCESGSYDDEDDEDDSDEDNHDDDEESKNSPVGKKNLRIKIQKDDDDEGDDEDE